MRDYKNVEAVNPALEFAKGGISGACIALILYCIAASLVNDEPEEPKLYVKNSQVQQCMPENNRMFSVMKLRNVDGTNVLECEKHEAMGYGKAPQNLQRIQLAISEE